jgi:hypothetical protein
MTRRSRDSGWRANLAVEIKCRIRFPGKNKLSDLRGLEIEEIEKRDGPLSLQSCLSQFFDSGAQGHLHLPLEAGMRPVKALSYPLSTCV